MGDDADRPLLRVRILVKGGPGEELSHVMVGGAYEQHRGGEDEGVDVVKA